MRRKLIIAGNYVQADRYVRKNNFGINDFRIINDERHMRGIGAENIEFVLVGNYWKNYAYSSPIFRALVDEGAKITEEE